mmetsp:Transcript_54758/g.110080  ORF Transcript_54758/g.110080 Transcript_54758/m.110080 type:complete len:270 (+) Transcript_54758:102-911(+)
MFTGVTVAAAIGGAAIGSAVTAGAFLRRATLWSPKPNPMWEPGGGSKKGPVDSMVTLVPSELPQGKSYYAFLVSAVVPRPIAFVSTISEDGKVNVAPFSFFGVMCHDPPTLVFCTIPRKGKPKDTLANCLSTKECVVNMVSEDIVEAVNMCSGEYPADVDEFALSGLTPIPSSLPWKTPRVGEAKVQMECTVKELKDLTAKSGEVGGTMVICEIKRIHVHSDVHKITENGSPYVDLGSYKPIGRLGGNDYGRTGGVFAMPRPSAVPRDN